MFGLTFPKFRVSKAYIFIPHPYLISEINFISFYKIESLLSG